MSLGNSTLFRIIILVNVLILPLESIGQTYKASIFAGGYYHDGPALKAKFYDPSGTAVDAAGNVYVSDKDNHRIRKINSSGIVTTLAGGGGTGWNGGGYADGVGTAARFNSPTGIAVDLSGYIYVADTWNNCIRKISPSGIVTTLAGGGNIGKENGNYADGKGKDAQFNSPQGIAVDRNGNILVADSWNNCIRRVSPSGVVSTLAGSGDAGFADGIGTIAQFSNPIGIAVDKGNNIYIADYDNLRIRKINSFGVVTTFAGNGEKSFVGGSTKVASFWSPCGVAVDDTGNVFVAEEGFNVIRKISKQGVVTTLAGTDIEGYKDGKGEAASFNVPFGLAVDNEGNVIVADKHNNRIRKVSPNGVVSTFAGSTGFGFTDAFGTEATFYDPSGVAIDRIGNVYVADKGSNRIRKINPYGDVITLAGSGEDGYGYGGFKDGKATIARFSSPNSVVIDSLGNVYVADSWNHCIRKINPEGMVSTLAGSGKRGYANGKGKKAQFNSPSGLAIDLKGSILVTEQKNHCVRIINPKGEVTTLAGSRKRGYLNGTSKNAKFNSPAGVAVDRVGNIFITDLINNRIRKISPDGLVSTFAGSKEGFKDGIGVNARFSYPCGIAIDDSGYVFITEVGNSSIRKISPNKVVTTIVGQTNNSNQNELIRPNSTETNLFYPLSLCLDRKGNIYIADERYQRIIKLSPRK